MNELEFLGYVITALITLGGFIGVVFKFVQPINELRVVIQKLNDSIDAMKNNDEKRDKRLDKHEDQIDKLDHRVGKIETKISMYHDHKGPSN